VERLGARGTRQRVERERACLERSRTSSVRWRARTSLGLVPARLEANEPPEAHNRSHLMNNNQQKTQPRSFQVFRTVGLAIDPIHVGTGGARLGRVDNTIVRDPATQIPKIPGSSLAGVYRAYAAMAMEDERCSLTDEEQKQRGWEQPFYPNHAGQDAGMKNDGKGPINAVFGHRNFAGLAAFSDAQILLFPVASHEGPLWVTSPGALRFAGADVTIDEATQRAQRGGKEEVVNLVWLRLKAFSWHGLEAVKEAVKAFGVHDDLCKDLRIVDRLVL